MAFIRRGYVPTSIPITSALVLTQKKAPLYLWPAEISCFEEHENEAAGVRLCKFWTLEGRAISVDQSFDEVAGALAELVVDELDDADPSSLGVEVVYATANQRKGAIHV